MKILFFDCFSGISGDMTVAALVDAGADQAYIEEELRKIEIEPFHLKWQRVNKCGISALKLDVLPDEQQPPYGHRHYAEIDRLLESSGLSERTVRLSRAIFRKIGEAEAKIHNIPLERVHFHEVGAIDSIADVVGTALAIDSLDIERIIFSPIPLGAGLVQCDHGTYPVPAPATLEMMRGLPIATSKHMKELTTPTGAGIAAALADAFSQGLPPMIVEAIGYGAGTRDLPNQPNVLRAVVGKTDPYLAGWKSEVVPAHTHGHNHEHTHEHPHHHAHDHARPHEHRHEHHGMIREDRDHRHEHSHHHEHDNDHHAPGHRHEHDQSSNSRYTSKTESGHVHKH